MVSKYYKTGQKNNCQGTQQKGTGLQSAGQCQLVGKPESDYDAQNEYADVHNKNIAAKNGGIDVVENGNEQ